MVLLKREGFGFKGSDIMEKLLQICSFLAKEYRKEVGKEITNLPLQKLLYYIEAVSLLENKEVAFYNKIEAWRYGPVVTDAYREFKQNKLGIESMETDLLSEYIKNVIIRIVKALGKKDPFLLVKKTHTYDTWIESWNNLDDKTISMEKIKNYHGKRISEGKGAF